MCPGLGEWWLHKIGLNLRNLVCTGPYAQTVSRIPCRHFVLCKMASKLSIDIIVLVSDFVVLVRVVIILSEWWSVLTTVGTSLLS